jgi:TfoX/Sxy family transcriptional regulator of competence genes
MAVEKEAGKILPDKLALYDKLIETNPAIERKGVTIPYTSHNGHMFTFLSSRGILAIRLSENDRENFIKKYQTSLIEEHGVIMKEYVAVPENLLKKTGELKAYLNASYDYVKTLKPKTPKKTRIVSKKLPEKNNSR